MFCQSSSDKSPPRAFWPPPIKSGGPQVWRPLNALDILGKVIPSHHWGTFFPPLWYAGVCFLHPVSFNPHPRVATVISYVLQVSKPRHGELQYKFPKGIWFGHTWDNQASTPESIWHQTCTLNSPLNSHSKRLAVLRQPGGGSWGHSQVAKGLVWAVLPMFRALCCSIPISKHFYNPWLTVPNGSFLFLGLVGKKNSFWACDTILGPLMSEIMMVLNWSSLPQNETSLSPLFGGLFNDFFPPVVFFFSSFFFFFSFSLVAQTQCTRGLWVFGVANF